jgi:hypothetical protein
MIFSCHKSGENFWGRQGAGGRTDTDGDTEITSGEQVEQWAGGHENYSYQENKGITTVTVDMDAVEEYLDYFESTYPAALDKLKEISER